jgi:hypothetical protein
MRNPQAAAPLAAIQQAALREAVIRAEVIPAAVAIRAEAIGEVIPQRGNKTPARTLKTTQKCSR